MFWLGAVMSLCYVPGFTGAFIATQWPVLAVLLPLALFRSGPVTAFHWAGLAFLLYGVVALSWSAAPQFSVFGLWLVLLMGLSLWLGTTLTSTRDLYAGLATGAAVSSQVAVFQHFGLDAIPYVSAAPAGLYVNSVQQGTVLALIAVALASERMWLWALPLAPGIALAGSRGAWLALAVGLVACRVRRLWLLAALAAAGACYLTAPLSPSDHERLLIWGVAWHNLTLLGTGPGTFYAVWLPSLNLFPEHAHNDALQLAFEYGVGAAPALAIFAYVLSRTNSREWPVVVAFVTAGCYSMPLWMPVASFLGLVAVGRVLRVYGPVFDGRSVFGRLVVPWRRAGSGQGCGVIPVASHYRTEG